LAAGSLVAEAWEDINAQDTDLILLGRGKWGLDSAEGLQDFLEYFLHHAVAVIYLTTTILMVVVN